MRFCGISAISPSSGDMLKRCITCGKNAKDFAEFHCANCSEKLVRCYYCRENRNKYVCACGFSGP